MEMGRYLMGYYVYMLLCADGSYYTGSTNDVARRTRMHNAGRGAKYTRSRRPVQLVYQEACPNKGAALRREYQLKQLTHGKKKQLVQAQQLARSIWSEQEKQI